MIRRPPRSTHCISSAASDVYKRQVQNTADIIGHEDIRSTMAYRRYALSKEEINDLLEKITNNETEINR